MMKKTSDIQDTMIAIVKAQPPDSSWEEIMRELMFGRMIERGLADSAAGRRISHEEMRRRIESWK